MSPDLGEVTCVSVCYRQSKRAVPLETGSSVDAVRKGGECTSTSLLRQLSNACVGLRIARQERCKRFLVAVLVLIGVVVGSE